MSDEPGTTDPMERDSLYRELHRRAEHLMRGQPKNHTLQATALVNEVFLKLHGVDPSTEDRSHYLAVASRAMRQVLVDHARAKGRQKRNPNGEKLPLDDVMVSYEERAHDLVALDEAVARLGEFDETMARAVELRFFGGLSVAEAADRLGISLSTAEADWRTARAWLGAHFEGSR